MWCASCAFPREKSPQKKRQRTRGLAYWRTGLAPSLLPSPGAVAITVTTTALAGECRVVWCGATRASRHPGFECGLARESVGGVGSEVGL